MTSRQRNTVDDNDFVTIQYARRSFNFNSSFDYFRSKLQIFMAL